MARSYLKEWRKHRDLTQEQVVNRLAAFDDPKLPQTAASLSRIESGKQIYTERILEALAEVYQCDAHELIGRNPLKEGQVIHLPAFLSESQVRQINFVVEALIREVS